MPVTVLFNVDSSIGAITTYELDVDGDGTPDYSGVNASSVNVSHIYNASGTYTATLTIKGVGVADKQDTETITVTAPPPPVSDTMILQYKFNETSGNSLDDSSDHTFTGVFEGAHLVRGHFGNALKFNAGKVTIPTGVFDQLKDQLTVTCWIRDQDATANDQAFLYGTKANETHFYQIGIVIHH